MGKILVVDDEGVIRELLKRFLETKGQEVITAGSGKEAIEKIKERPNLVLLDIMMSDMHGLKVLDIIKEISPSTEVIMVTALNEPSIGRESFLRGAFDFVTKPIDLTHLEKLISFKLFEMTIKNET